MFKRGLLFVLLVLRGSAEDKYDQFSEIVDFSGQNIEFLDLLEFSYYSFAQEINLANNQIREVPLNTFRHNYDLIRLNFSGNVGLILPENRSLVYSSYLQELDLSGCGVKSLPAGIFDDATKLKIIDLSNNPLEAFEVEVLKPLKNIQKLIIPQSTSIDPDLICRDYEIMIEFKDENGTEVMSCDEVRNELLLGEQKDDPNVAPEADDDYKDDADYSENEESATENPEDVEKTTEDTPAAVPEVDPGEKPEENPEGVEKTTEEIHLFVHEVDPGEKQEEITEEVEKTTEEKIPDMPEANPTEKQEENPEGVEKTMEEVPQATPEAEETKPEEKLDNLDVATTPKLETLTVPPKEVIEEPKGEIVFTIFPPSDVLPDVNQAIPDEETTKVPEDIIVEVIDDKISEETTNKPAEDKMAVKEEVKPDSAKNPFVGQRAGPIPKPSQAPDTTESPSGKDGEGKQAAGGANTEADPASGSNILVILVVAVIVIAAGAFGYRFYKKRKYAQAATEEPQDKELQEIVTNKPNGSNKLNNIREEEPLVLKNDVEIKEIDEDEDESNGKPSQVAKREEK